MECFGTADFDNNSRLITLSAIIISGLHCICKYAHRTVCKKQNVFVLKQVQSILARLDDTKKCMYHSDSCVPV